MGLLSGHQDIEELLKSDELAPNLRQALTLSLEVKAFAENDLKLKKSGNYTRYKDLGRDYVIVSLTAAPKLKLEPNTWSFPFFGAFPYLGFFDVDDAKKKQKEMNEAGFDTSLRKVSAFSTLGFFRDAVLNTMVDDIPYLMETIIHELTHVTVYHKNAGTFNENLAAVVGFEGARMFLQSLSKEKWPKRDEWIKKHEERLTKAKGVALWTKRAREQLEKVYASQASDQEKLAAREKVFTSLRDDWVKNVSPAPPPVLNNAYIVSIGTYSNMRDQMYSKLKELGSIPALVAWAKNQHPSD